jgi:TolB protein
MRRSILTVLSLLALAAPLTAQQTDPPPGIRLSATYDARQRPLLALRPLEAPAPIAEAVDSIGTILQRDLTYSSRYNMAGTVPEALRTGTVDYAQWNSLNVVYLVTGSVTPTAAGYELAMGVHDVVYRRVLHEGRYALPAATDPDFRMAVHAVSDEVVRRTLNAPGSAATRVAFTRQNRDANGSYDLLIVDADGFGLRRIAGFGGQLYSPVWSPDARRVLYAVNGPDGWKEFIERDIASGSQRSFRPGGDMALTPAYAPDGRSIVYARWVGDRSEIMSYDIQRQCCAARLSGQGRNIEMNPVFSADGRQLAFNSDRLGRNAIFVMARDGANPTLLSPYVPGQASEYTSPSWSPTGSRVAFHGHWNKRARGWAYQIMVADASRPGAPIEQITSRGENEDPSWAPDGRHLVYTGVGDGPGGLYVIDIETKTRRLLVSGGNMRMADWSPPLVRAADLVARP